jgi:hypothetical protein
VSRSLHGGLRCLTHKQQLGSETKSKIQLNESRAGPNNPTAELVDKENPSRENWRQQRRKSSGKKLWHTDRTAPNKYQHLGTPLLMKRELQRDLVQRNKQTPPVRKSKAPKPNFASRRPWQYQQNLDEDTAEQEPRCYAHPPARTRELDLVAQPKNCRQERKNRYLWKKDPRTDRPASKSSKE